MSKSQRKNRTLALSLVTVIVPPLLGLLGIVYTVAHDDAPPVDCGSQVEVYVEQLEQHPTAELALPEDSEIEKQCNINDLLDSIRQEQPRQIGPG